MTEEPIWVPDGPNAQTEHNPRFTERDPHFMHLFEQASRAQFSPQELAKMPDGDIIYLAGHIERPDDADPHRWTKMRQNADRATAELQRRTAAKIANSQSWMGLRNGLIVAVVAALFGFAFGRFTTTDSTDDPQPVVVVTTTSTTVAPTVVTTTSTTAAPTVPAPTSQPSTTSGP